MRKPVVLPSQGEFDPIDLTVIPRNGLPVDLGRQFSLRRGGHRIRTADRLFAALDGCEVRTFGQRFDLEVFSVTDQSSGRWVQIGLKGIREYFVTLCLPQQSGISEATHALSEWLADPAHFEVTVDVA